MWSFRGLGARDPTSLYGVAVLTGVGFTMSLFIGTLAFEDETLMALSGLVFWWRQSYQLEPQLSC